MKGRSWGNAYADAALLTSGRPACRFNGVVKTLKYCPSIDEERAASVGQLHAARLAAKQLHVKFPFDRLDQSTERWLLDVEPLRCPRNMTFFSDSDEVPEMSQFHCHTQTGMNFGVTIAWLRGPQKPIVRRLSSIHEAEAVVPGTPGGSL
jgi:hypothetical protein